MQSAHDPISHVVGDRLAFAIAKDPTKRQEISANFREAYGLRSRRTHHGLTVQASQVLRDFFDHAYRWFNGMLYGLEQFNTHAEFIARIDKLKYGMPS